MRYRLRTLLLLCPTTLMLAGAAVELYRYLAVVRLGRTKQLPATMYSEHLGLAVALVAIALILIVIAARQESPIAAR